MDWEDLFEQLYRKLYSKIIIHIYSSELFKDLPDDKAEDLVQESFLKLEKELQKGTQIDTPLAYLKKIAENTYKDILRKKALKIVDDFEDSTKNKSDSNEDEYKKLLYEFENFVFPLQKVPQTEENLRISEEEQRLDEKEGEKDTKGDERFLLIWLFSGIKKKAKDSFVQPLNPAHRKLMLGWYYQSFSALNAVQGFYKLITTALAFLTPLQREIILLYDEIYCNKSLGFVANKVKRPPSDVSMEYMRGKIALLEHLSGCLEDYLQNPAPTWFSDWKKLNSSITHWDLLGILLLQKLQLQGILPHFFQHSLWHPNWHPPMFELGLLLNEYLAKTHYPHREYLNECFANNSMAMPILYQHLVKNQKYGTGNINRFLNKRLGNELAVALQSDLLWKALEI